MHLLFAPECTPFAIAALMLAGLTAMEIVAMLCGFSLSHVIDKPDLDGHAGGGALLAWINIGRVPILILVMLALGFFAIWGFTIQAFAAALWSPLPPAVAGVAAVALTLPSVRISSRAVARIVPRDETYAVEPGDFVGHTAEVVTGPLDQGLPGRVRLKDAYGNWHMLRAVAAKDQPPLPVGAAALLVDRADTIFVAVHPPAELIETEQTPASKANHAS